MNIPLYFKFTDILRSHQCLQHQELEMHRRHSKISLGFIFQLKSPNLAISFPPLLKLKKEVAKNDTLEKIELVHIKIWSFLLSLQQRFAATKTEARDGKWVGGWGGVGETLGGVAQRKLQLENI